MNLLQMVCGGFLRRVGDEQVGVVRAISWIN